MLEGDPLIKYGIKIGFPHQNPSTLLPHELEDVLGQPLVSVVVGSELVFNLVDLPQEDVDHSQFFRLIIAQFYGLLRYVTIAVTCYDNCFRLILNVVFGASSGIPALRHMNIISAINFKEAALFSLISI